MAKTTLTMNDLAIDPEGVDLERLLGEWGWAMQEPMRPVLLTTLGDVFAQGISTAVYFVDVVTGTIECVADCGEGFEKQLQDPEFVSGKFIPERVATLMRAGLKLGPGQVYSHKKPLVLGGEDELDNYEATDISVHVSIHGQIHRQVSELPEGTPIRDIKID